MPSFLSPSEIEHAGGVCSLGGSTSSPGAHTPQHQRADSAVTSQVRADAYAVSGRLA